MCEVYLIAISGLHIALVAGDKLGDWEVLHPEAGEDFSKSTDDAVVLRTTINDIRILLLSDLGRLGQRALIRRHPKLRADLVFTSIADDGHTLESRLLALLRPRIILVQSPSRSACRRACGSGWSNLGHVSFTRGVKVA